MAIQYFKLVSMAAIVRLAHTNRQLNVSKYRPRLPLLGYAPAELRNLPEGLAVTIRRAGPHDDPAIAHLAEIDEAPVPAGQLLVADVGGELWAAVSIDRDQGISDPFRPSGDLLRALAERAGRRPGSPAAQRVRVPSKCSADTGPLRDGRSHPPLVRVRASADPPRRAGTPADPAPRAGTPADPAPRAGTPADPATRASAPADPATRVAASADPAAEPDVGVRSEQHDAAIGVERAEDEHFGDERTNLPGCEVDDRDDEPAVEVGWVVVDDLSRRASGAELGTEVDRQLPGGLAGLGKGVDGDHPTDSHVDPGEVVELDHGPPNIAATAATAATVAEGPAARASMPTPPAWLAWLALGTVYVVWGSTYLAIRVMVRTVPALLGAGVRFLVAGLVLYGWIWVRRAHGRHRGSASGRARGREWGRVTGTSGRAKTRRRPAAPGGSVGSHAGLRVSGREAAGAAVVGVLLTFGGNGLVTLAERHIASSLAALLIASEPFVIVLVGAVIGERASRGTLAGVTVGFAGVTILVLPGASAGGSGLVGALLVLAASVSWGIGSISSTRVRLPADLGVSTALQMIFGGGVMVVAGLIGGEAGRLDASGLSTESLVAFGYLVVFGSIVAFSAYTWLLQHVQISRVSTYAYVNPMIAVLLGWIVLGESISLTTLIGASVIVGSVAFTIRSTRPPVTPAGGGAPDGPTVATAHRRV